MIINSIAVILADSAAVDNGVYACIAFLVVGSLIALAICKMIPQKPWPADIMDRDDGHRWVKGENEKW